MSIQNNSLSLYCMCIQKKIYVHCSIAEDLFHFIDKIQYYAVINIILCVKENVRPQIKWKLTKTELKKN